MGSFEQVGELACEGGDEVESDEEESEEVRVNSIFNFVGGGCAEGL